MENAKTNSDKSVSLFSPLVYMTATVVQKLRANSEADGFKSAQIPVCSSITACWM